jgi:hypothetical protein
MVEPVPLGERGQDLVFFIIDEFMMNPVKSLPYGWALCGRTEQSSSLVEKDGVPSGTKPEDTGGIPK